MSTHDLYNTILRLYDMGLLSYDYTFNRLTSIAEFLGYPKEEIQSFIRLILLAG